ncbi:unnamed protein product [Linum tenue]|uniref:Uncharacterized protein n=1 Tax=Linum tenue TaxID=586396 RepID=A0AAV0HZW3_9ROSI|nr:unnamed protein product [Linum tenue]
MELDPGSVLEWGSDAWLASGRGSGDNRGGNS